MNGVGIATVLKGNGPIRYSACMAATASGSLVVIDDVIADKISKMNCGFGKVIMPMSQRPRVFEGK